MLHNGRMAGLVKLRRSIEAVTGGQLWADCVIALTEWQLAATCHHGLISGRYAKAVS